VIAGIKTHLKRLTASQQLLRVEVPRHHVTERLEHVYHDLQKRAILPGFRRGKVPRDLLEQHHGAQARDEMIRQLVAESLDAAVKEARAQVVGRITVGEVKLDERTGLSYQATLEVAPQVKLGRYKGLLLRCPSPTVTEEDIHRALERLREAHAEAVPVAGSAQKEKRLPALDDEFAKDVGVGSLAVLRERLRAELTAHHERETQPQLREALAEALLQRMEFEVPPSLIERRTEQLQRDFVMRLMLQGVAEADLKEPLQQATPQLTTNATKLVKLAFIIQAIAAAEHLSVSEEELHRRLEQLAARWQLSLEAARQQLERKQLWESFQQELLYEQTVAWLLQHAQIERGTR